MKILVFVILDFILGYGHAWMNPKIRPDSRKMFHGIVKLLVYSCLLIAGYQTTFLLGGTLFQSIIEAYIGLTEFKSVLENIQKICVLKNIDIPFLSSIINKVDGKIEEAGKWPHRIACNRFSEGS